MTNPSEPPSISKISASTVAVIVIGIVLLISLAVYAQSRKATNSATCPVPNASPSSEQAAADNNSQNPPTASPSPAPTGETRQNTPQADSGLPRFVDLGTTTCTPCKMMIPVIESLRTKYAGKMQVDFINVAENNTAAQQYQVRVIPLQIFFDPSGKEMFRHQGYWPEADIMAKWKELGFEFQ